MKKILLASLLAASFAANAQSDIITLDLTKADTELEFNADNGAWTKTFDDNAATIDSQKFSFLHYSIASWMTWYGFTVSNSADNTAKDDYITYGFSNMAKGGIVLDENGIVKTDEYGAPVVSADVPYLVAFTMDMMYTGGHIAEMVMNDGLDYMPVGMYVNLNSYAYYVILDGNGFSRPFTNGDNFTLTIHGQDSEGNEKTLDVTLTDVKNGDFTINRGWKYVDLTPLGKVNQMWFTQTSTDSGIYGMNTPAYFCMDKLMVRPVDSSSVSSISARNAAISYDRASSTVTLEDADFAIVYDTAGNSVMSSHDAQFSVASLNRGVYVVKAGNAVRKIVR